jgi:fermentation-respiration switch protein FrsA (DUF1100 family)
MSSTVTARAKPATLRRRARLPLYLLRLSGVALIAATLGYLAVSYRVADEFTRPTRGSFAVVASAIGASSESVTFQSTDGVALRGWFFPGSGGDRAVILVHGRNGNRTGDSAATVARFLLANGYSVLTFDLRGHGQSDGERFSLGYLERRDVAGAVDYLVARGYRQERIALLGSSMGAGTVLQSIELRPNVGPIIADSSYVHGRQIVEEKAPEITGLPAAFNPGIILMARVAFGLDVDEVDPAAFVSANPGRPFFFIHCDHDTTTHVGHSYALKAASANPASELWVATGCEHVLAVQDHPAEYERRVLAFLAAHMR